MQIAEPLRTIIVEPCELSTSEPTAEPKPQQPQPEHESVSV